MVCLNSASRHLPNGDRMIFQKMITPLLLACLLGGAACSKNSATDPDDDGGGGGSNDAPYWVEAAWDSYDEGDMVTARNHFTRALDRDSTYVPAVSGLGWINLEFGYTGLSQTEFEEALALNSGYVPALCGRAITAHAEALNVPPRASERLAITVDAASKAIQIGGEGWQFERIESINSRQMRVLLAIAHFELGDYSASHEQIDLLDPGNDLDASNPDYVRLLLIELENQRAQL